MITFIYQNGRNTSKKEKNTVITEITLTISNAEHIKQTLSTNKSYRHQQYLPKISQNVSGDLYSTKIDSEVDGIGEPQTARKHSYFFVHLVACTIQVKNIVDLQ